MLPEINIVCVYRVNPRSFFSAEYVYRLHALCAEFLPIPFSFHCLTDDDTILADYSSGIIGDPFLRDWPGWWSKPEIFAPGYLSATALNLYLDLDTMPVNDLRHILEVVYNSPAPCFAAAPEVASSDPTRIFNSSVMCWRGDFAYLYETLCQKWSPQLIADYLRGNMNRWGDQGFISEHLLVEPVMLGSLVASYKHHTPEQRKEASVVYFHGRPRPHEVNWSPW